MHQQLQKIDILRGIAILLVFGYHTVYVVFGEYEIKTYQRFWVDMQQLTSRQLLLNLNPFGQGHLGVQLFLVISGFLIHWGYLKGGSRFEPAKFYSKRFWRIYPPYLVALLIFYFATGTASTLSLLTHLTLTHNLFSATFFDINPAFWSLALEMQLYIIYPLFLLLHKRFGLTKSVLAVAFIALVAAGIGIVFTVGEPLSASILNKWIVWVLGAYLGEKFFYKQRLYKGRFIYLAAAYVLVIVLKTTILSVYLTDVLFSLLCICVIDWYLHTEVSLTRLEGKLSKALALIGLYSYSIYLFHNPLLKPLIGFFSLNFFSTPLVGLAVLVTFVIIFALAFLSYRLLELPSIQIGTRVYEKFFTNHSLKIKPQGI